MCASDLCEWFHKRVCVSDEVPQIQEFISEYIHYINGMCQNPHIFSILLLLSEIKSELSSLNFHSDDVIVVIIETEGIMVFMLYLMGLRLNLRKQW